MVARTTETVDWHVAFSAALLTESAEAADRMELAAAELEKNPATRGIANILRDRAEDIRRASKQNKKTEQRER